MSKFEEPDILFNMLNCLRILCLHGECLYLARKDHPHFLSYIQEKMIIPRWDHLTPPPPRDHRTPPAALEIRDVIVVLVALAEGVCLGILYVSEICIVASVDV